MAASVISAASLELREFARRALRWAPPPVKRHLEGRFWRQELTRYEAWYEGRVPSLYGVPAPTSDQKIVAVEIRHAALLTWLELHQKPKYLVDLDLGKDALRGRVLDVGAGPLPSATVFNGIELYCLDPMYHSYLAAGYPLHHYNARFVHAPCESIPLEDDFIDVVLSVNAIDHVDDFERSAAEIRRVLKPGGRLAMHVHYHPPISVEPIELSDTRFRAAFDWCEGLTKLREVTEKSGAAAAKGESYVLWRNF